MAPKNNVGGLGYKETLDIISRDLHDHQFLLSKDEPILKVVDSISERLKYRQSRTAFAALLFLIDCGCMMPKLSEPFSSWERPEINLEFDHKGTFKEMSGSTCPK